MKYGLITWLLAAAASIFWFWQSKQIVLQPEEPKKAPSDYFLRQRAYPFEDIDYQAVAKARRQLLAFKQDQSKAHPAWVNLGPTTVGGRLTDVEILPNGTILLGSATGGIFKSDDEGNSWTPIFEDAFSLSIGDMAYAPSQPERLYVGTGEANGGGGSSTYAGVGIYRSDDAGKTWQRAGLERSRYVGRIVVHPENPDLVYVAAMGRLYANDVDRGLYRSKDGGLNWEKVLYLSEATGCIDVVIDPQRPERLFAAMWQREREPSRISYAGPESGIYFSDDGGDTWEEVTEGLPTGASVGRIGLALSASNPDILYSIYADGEGPLAGVFKSENGGASWTRTNDEIMANNYRTFGWWFGQIRVHPTNSDFVFALGLDIYFSRDGGQSWSNYPDYADENNLISDFRDFMHVDQHGLAFHPADPNFIVSGNDGGVYISKDETLFFKNANDLSNIQFYTCEIDPSNPGRVFGGTQDNGTWGNDTGRVDGWIKYFGGDGFHVEIDPRNPNSIYMEYQYGGLYHLLNGEYIDGTGHLTETDRANWSAPILIDPNNPDVVYHASQRLFRADAGVQSFVAISEDLTKGDPGGNRVFGTISAFDVAIGDSQTIYVGTDDGNFQVTTDGGVSWENRNQGLPNRYITGVAVHPQDKQTVYVTLSGFQLVDYQPHLMRSRDSGKNWEDVSANLPEAPLNDIVIDPTDPKRLFVASDFGVFMSEDEGNSWTLLGQDLPNTIVSDLDLHPESKTLVAATFGRGMFRLDLAPILETEAHQGSRLKHRYILAELRGGLVGTSYIGIVNPGDQPVELELFSFAKDGTSLESSPANQMLGPFEKLWLSLDEAFPQSSQSLDWVQVAGAGTLVVFAEIGDVQSRSAFLAGESQTGRVYVPHVAQDTRQFETFTSSVNPFQVTLGTQILSGLNENEQPIREHFSGYGQMARDVRDYFGQNLDSVAFATFQETLRGPVSMEYFHRIPGRSQMAALGLTGEQGKTLRFLHVAGDTARFWTGMVYINVGPEPARVIEKYYAAHGELLEERQRDDLASEAKVTLLFDEANAQGLPRGTAWIEVLADQNLIGYDLFGAAVNSGNDYFAGIQGAYSSSNTMVFPHFQASDSRWLGLVAVNTGAEPADLTLDVFDSGGTRLEQKMLRAVPGKGKATVLVGDFFELPETKTKGAWVRAVGANSVWNGFLLWGDHGQPQRQNMSGLVAVPSEN